MTTTEHLFDTTGKHLVTLAEAADLVHVSTVTLRRAVRDKKLAHYRPGGSGGKILIKVSDLESFMGRSRRSAIGE